MAHLSTLSTVESGTGITTGLDRLGFAFRQAHARFSFFKASVQAGPGTPASLLFTGCSGSSVGIKRPGHDVDQSPPSGDMAKNELSYISTSPAYFYGVDRNNVGLLSE
jgi:hypothetical protein